LELQDTSEAISDYIRKCSHIIHTKGHHIAKEFGLTYDQYHLLIYLMELDTPPTINEISNKSNRAQNTISEKISRLEGKGLVKRINDVCDRRITRVAITEDGLKLIKDIKKERSNRVIYAALSKMEEVEVDNLLSALEKLYNNLKEGNGID